MTVATVVLFSLQAAQLLVGPTQPYASIGTALAAAEIGDTIRVAAGVYREHLTIDRPIVLLAEPGTVIDGGGRGAVITITAPAVVRGFTVRASGRNQSREDGGIVATGTRDLVIEDNRFEDVLFGIYLKQCDRAVIRGNVVEGKRLPPPLRGDGIRLWYSHGGRVEDNTLRRVRDLVIWFSDSSIVRGNRVSDSRYGLHFMYSRHNVFEDNAFVDNDVGAFIMYSTDIVFRRNLFASARGPNGRGLGFKDADRVLAEDNMLVKNAVGISIDNSPHSEGVTNQFRNNTIAYNDVAVALLPSVHDNRFTGNRFIDNVQPVAVSGGGSAGANTWHDNYWSEYAGFDRDGNGHGDTPHIVERLADDVFAKHEALKVFNLSLAAEALNTLSRVLPLLSPRPILVDSAPRVTRGRP